MNEKTVSVEIGETKKYFTVLGQLNSILKQFHEMFLSSWEAVHKSKLAGFLKTQETCLRRLNEIASAENPSTKLWAELEAAIKELLEQAESLQYIDENYSAAQFWEEWRRQFRIYTNN